MDWYRNGTEDSKNGHEHKCPCCGYEVKIDWLDRNFGFIKGDESFIKIENGLGRTTAFETDRPKIDRSEGYMRVYLLGCPKCGCVSFQQE